MKAIVRTIAPAVAVLAALGVAAPAASAKPAHAKAGHVKVKVDKPGKATAAKVKADKAARKLAAAQQRVAREAGRKAAAIELSVKDSRLAGLDQVAVDALKANATADAEALRLLAVDAAAADATALQALADGVGAYRAEFYTVLVNRVRYAASLQVLAADDATTVAAIDAIIAPALAYHADSGTAVLGDLHKQLAAIAETLEPETGEVLEEEAPAVV